MSDVTIADVMRAYADDAVTFAKRQFDITLDFSERSLEHVDRILADHGQGGSLVPGQLSDAEREELWMFCKMMGGYIGEVIVRNIGGEWQTKDLGSGDVSVVLVTADVRGSPPEAVWRTLTEPYKGIVTYYRGLRAILGHGEENTEHGFRSIRVPPLSEQPPQGGTNKRKRPWWKVW
jgi:hypothetical protein